MSINLLYTWLQCSAEANTCRLYCLLYCRRCVCCRFSVEVVKTSSTICFCLGSKPQQRVTLRHAHLTSNCCVTTCRYHNMSHVMRKPTFCICDSTARFVSDLVGNKNFGFLTSWLIYSIPFSQAINKNHKCLVFSLQTNFL